MLHLVLLSVSSGDFPDHLQPLSSCGGCSSAKLSLSSPPPPGGGLDGDAALFPTRPVGKPLFSLIAPRREARRAIFLFILH